MSGAPHDLVHAEARHREPRDAAVPPRTEVHLNRRLRVDVERAALDARRAKVLPGHLGDRVFRDAREDREHELAVRLVLEPLQKRFQVLVNRDDADPVPRLRWLLAVVPRVPGPTHADDAVIDVHVRPAKGAELTWAEVRERRDRVELAPLLRDLVASDELGELDREHERLSPRRSGVAVARRAHPGAWVRAALERSEVASLRVPGRGLESRRQRAPHVHRTLPADPRRPAAVLLPRLDRFVESVADVLDVVPRDLDDRLRTDLRRHPPSPRVARVTRGGAAFRDLLGVEALVPYVAALAGRRDAIGLLGGLLVPLRPVDRLRRVLALLGPSDMFTCRLLTPTLRLGDVDACAAPVGEAHLAAPVEYATAALSDRFERSRPLCPASARRRRWSFHLACVGVRGRLARGLRFRRHPSLSLAVGRPRASERPLISKANSRRTDALDVASAGPPRRKFA